jgi:hypothetical protein
MSQVRQLTLETCQSRLTGQMSNGSRLTQAAILPSVKGDAATRVLESARHLSTSVTACHLYQPRFLPDLYCLLLSAAVWGLGINHCAMAHSLCC